MDPAAKAATREMIASLRESGTTVLLTTHELADVERLADRIAIIDRGRIVASGTLAELAAGAAPRLRFRLDQALGPADEAALSMALAAAHGGAVGPAPGSRSLRIDGGPGSYLLDGLDSRPELVAALAAWCAARGLLIAELRTTGATLEERYLALTGSVAPGPGGQLDD